MTKLLSVSPKQLSIYSLRLSIVKKWPGNEILIAKELHLSRKKMEGKRRLYHSFYGCVLPSLQEVLSVRPSVYPFVRQSVIYELKFCEMRFPGKFE